MWDGTTLTSPNGGTITINEKARQQLDAAIKAAPRAPQPGDRFEDAPRKGSDPNPKQQDNRPDDLMLWYADPAEHADAYISVSYEDNGTVLVRDGMDPTGAGLSFSLEQWAALSDEEDALGEPDGDKDHPAAVRNPDEIYKTSPTGKSKGK